MKLSIDTVKLEKALGQVRKIATGKDTSSAKVLLTAAGTQELTLCATDLETTITCVRAAEVASTGAIAVLVRPLHDYAKTLRVKTVDIEIRDGGKTLVLQTTSNRCSFNGIPADEFPPVPAYTPDPAQSFTMPVADLARMLDRTLFCVSTDEIRRCMTGIYCQSPEPRVLQMVATDGYRIASVREKLLSVIPNTKGVLVASKSFRLLRQLLRTTKNPVSFEVSPTQACIKMDNATLQARLKEETFPDFQRFTTSKRSRKASIDCANFAEALRRNVISQPKRECPILLKFQQNLLRLENEELNSQETFCIKYDEEPYTVRLNGRFLLDALEQFDNGAVQFEYSDAFVGYTMHQEKDRSEFLYIVMPMR